MRFFAALLLLLITGLGTAQAQDLKIVKMTRAQAAAAYQALAEIGQYPAVIRQGGQDVATTKYLDVSAGMRSTLAHDAAVLGQVYVETLKMQTDARAAVADDKAYERQVVQLAQVPIDVGGLILFDEADLALDKNPQITPTRAAALAVLESK